MLLDSGVNVSVHDEKNRTALHLASAKGDEKIGRLLLLINLFISALT